MELRSIVTDEDETRVREWWEGDHPWYCMEPLQPRPDVPIGDDEMIVPEYPQEVTQ